MKKINWWKENGWKVRIKIYTIITLPVDILEAIVVFLATWYRKFFSWLLWDLLHKVFCTKTWNQFKDEIEKEIRRVNEDVD